MVKLLSFNRLYTKELIKGLIKSMNVPIVMAAKNAKLRVLEMLSFSLAPKNLATRIVVPVLIPSKK